MKRLIASVIVVVAFTFYAIFSRDNTTTTPLALGSGSGSSSGTATTLPVVTGGDDDDDDDESAVAQQTASTIAASAPSSGYADGTYTGSEASALYGVVQVQVTIQGGKIADVQFLSHPTGRNSDQINAPRRPPAHPRGRRRAERERTGGFGSDPHQQCLHAVSAVGSEPGLGSLR